MPKISVIVPVYNAEKYLRECVDSIVGQSFADFELILIDDGSKDSSPAICDGYATTHDNIRVIHKENEGVSIARKTGVDDACGDCIMFVDSDDSIDEHCLKHVTELMDRHDADIVAFNAIREYSDGRREPFDLEQRGYFGRERIKAEIFPKLIHSENVDYYRPALWGNLFRKEIIAPYMIADSRATVGEDSACLIPAIYHADSMYFCDEEFYHYRINISSATNSHRAFDWDNPEVTSAHIAKHIDMSEGDFRAQLNRRICHDVFNVCLSQAYGYDSEDAFAKRCRSELSRAVYSDAIKNAVFRGNPMAAFMQKTLKAKLYGIIWLYSRLLMKKSAPEKDSSDKQNADPAGSKQNKNAVPKVLVLMSTYNGGQYIEEQIKSILSQEGVDVTILIRDDGSNDGTVKKIKEISDIAADGSGKNDRIDLIEGRNLGYRKSFYTLMEQADEGYDYYAFSDQDDIWLSDKLSRAIGLISKSSGSAAYCSSPLYVDEDLEPLDNCYSNLDALPAGRIRPEWAATGLTGLGCTFVWNRAMHELMIRDGLSSLNIGHDNFISVIAPAGDLYRESEGRILYRQHTDNASGSKEEDRGLHIIRRYMHTLLNFNKEDYELRRYIADNYKDVIGARGYGLLRDSIDYRTSAVKKAKLLAGNYARGLSPKERLKFAVRVLMNKY